MRVSRGWRVDGGEALCQNCEKHIVVGSGGLGTRASRSDDDQVHE